MKKFIFLAVIIVLLVSCTENISEVDSKNNVFNNEFEALQLNYDNLKRSSDQLIEEYDSLIQQYEEKEAEIASLNNTIERYEGMIEDLSEQQRSMLGRFIVSDDRTVIAYIVDYRETTGEYLVEVILNNNTDKLSFNIADILPYDRELLEVEVASLTEISGDNNIIYGVIGDGATVTAPFTIDISGGVATGYKDLVEYNKVKEKHLN